MANNQIVSSAASSSFSPSCSSLVSFKKYDVFLSFRGEDTRKNFTSHLHDALNKNKIETYIDYRLEKGDEISPALIRAIEESYISIVIFSENYASSKWCLDEISKIVECRKHQGQVVIPVFYNIDPSHVRKQTGSYKHAFAKHEHDLKHSIDKVHKWKVALTEAANLAGYDSQKYWSEAELIKQIVKNVLKKLEPIHIGQNTHKVLVGIDKHVAVLESLVAHDPKAVRVIGIWGMGGIGKTRIATLLYDRLCFEYEAYCFVEDVKENLQKHGMIRLQNELFCALLKEEEQSMGIPVIRCHFNMRRLRRKKILLVLDDVDDLRKLINLCAWRDWFGKGSRVIVTSRDKQVLTNLVDDIYEVKPLKFMDSLQLFSLHAFKENYPKKEWRDLSVKAVNYAKGLPLAIEVLGSSLHGQEKGVWESQLRKLEKMPHPEIQNVLRLSYDGLDREEQDIFLYLACFCFFSNSVFCFFLLDHCGYSTDAGVARLHDKALISVQNYLTFCRWTMHELIRDMAREIVVGESIDPGKRRHLWDPDDIYHVLQNATGTESLQSLNLQISSQSEELCLNPKAFNRMLNLKLLRLTAYDSVSRKSKMIALKDLESLPKGLRYLYWTGCPLKSLPSSFCAENLVKLYLSHSKLERLWSGVQNLVKLKEISLEACEHLMELPDFSKALNLKAVIVFFCTSLFDLHPSILSLPDLSTLKLDGCKNLKSWSLKQFSVMQSIKSLGLAFTGIGEVHSLGLPLNKLEYLSCGFSKSLPDNFLQVLNLQELRKLTLDSFDPRYFLNCLTSLNLSGTDIESLPTSIIQLSMLKDLWLSNCKRLRCIPTLPPSIDYLFVDNCVSLEGVSFSRVDWCWHYNGNFFFSNCWRLNQQAINNIMSFAHAKMEGAASDLHFDRKKGVYGGVDVILPGSKVPVDRYDYRTTTELTMSIQLSNLSNLMGVSFCFIISPISQGYYNPYETIHVICSLLTSDGQEDGRFGNSLFFQSLPYLGLDSYNALFLHNWPLSHKIKERSIDNQCTSSDLSLSFRITRINGIKVQEWGVHPIYTSDLFTPFSVPLALDAKPKKRPRDADQLLDMESLPPTKKLKAE